VVYNPQSLLRPDRLDEISIKFKCAAVVILNGTCMFDRDQKHWWGRARHHHVLHFSRGQLATGQSIMFHRRFFSRRSVTRVWCPSTHKLQGRFVAIRVKTPTVDICLMAGYSPFQAPEADNFFLELRKLVVGSYIRRGSRSIEILGIDANGHVGLVKLPRTTDWVPQASRAVGCKQPEECDRNGALLLAAIEPRDFYLVNTFTTNKPTFYSNSGQGSTRPDYVTISRRLLNVVVNCDVWTRAGDEMQPVASEAGGRRKHRPIVLTMQLALPYSSADSPPPLWDHDKICNAVLYGDHKDDFLIDLEHALPEVTEIQEFDGHASPDDAYEMLQDKVHMVAKTHFAATSNNRSAATHSHPAGGSYSRAGANMYTDRCGREGANIYTDSQRHPATASGVLNHPLSSASDPELDTCRQQRWELRRACARGPPTEQQIGQLRTVTYKVKKIKQARKHRYEHRLLGELQGCLHQQDAAGAYRVSRKLSYKCIGPKRGKLNEIGPPQYDKQEWIHKLQLPGLVGGVAARPVDWQQLRNQRTGVSRPSTPHERTLAKRDQRGTAMCIRYAKLRKQPNQWSVPVGILRILHFPHEKKKTKAAWCRLHSSQC